MVEQTLTKLYKNKTLCKLNLKAFAKNMPELPEIETLCQGLRGKIFGKTISQVIVRRKNLRYPFPPALAHLAGATVTAISRRSKLALLTLSSGQTLLLHLGMSGQVTFPTAGTPTGPHDHMSILFTDGTELRLRDPRRFGFVDLTPTAALPQSQHLKNLGLEPLDPQKFTPKILHTLTRGKNTPIKPWLMNSAHIVGIGNIYASEALFTAKIAPQKPASSLSAPACARLHAALVTTLEKAIAAGGSSLKDYIHTDGSLGYFQHQFNVYNKAGEPCPRCTTPIEKQTQATRSTYFCPKCQK